VPRPTGELRKSWRNQISPSIRTDLAKRADAEGITLGALVARLLAEGLERRTQS